MEIAPASSTVEPYLVPAKCWQPLCLPSNDLAQQQVVRRDLTFAYGSFRFPPSANTSIDSHSPQRNSKVESAYQIESLRCSWVRRACMCVCVFDIIKQVISVALI